MTAPVRGSLPGRIASRLPRRQLAAAVARALRPARAPLANLAASPLHAAGLACIDTGVFMTAVSGSLAAGLMVTGLSLIWLEHVIADEP